MMTSNRLSLFLARICAVALVTGGVLHLRGMPAAAAWTCPSIPASEAQSPPKLSIDLPQSLVSTTS
jgi:hypothetical protein